MAGPEETQWIPADCKPLGWCAAIADLPLGLIAGTPYSQTAVQLGPDDLLVLYTDGVTESTDANGEQLERDGLLALARAIAPGSAADTGQRMVADLEAFRGSKPPEDDETLVVLHHCRSTAEGPWPR